MKNMMFKYPRTIHVYETDLMGVVHHSNYLRFCEEARVAWFSKNGATSISTDEIFGLVVYETKVQHKMPIRYGDQIEIHMQMKVSGAKLIIQYLIRNQGGVCAQAETIHCRTDRNFKVQRLEKSLIQLVEKEKWIEI